MNRFEAGRARDCTSPSFFAELLRDTPEHPPFHPARRPGHSRPVAGRLRQEGRASCACGSPRGPGTGTGRGLRGGTDAAYAPFQNYVANNSGGKFKTLSDKDFVPQQYGVALKKGSTEPQAKQNK